MAPLSFLSLLLLPLMVLQSIQSPILALKIKSGNQNKAQICFGNDISRVTRYLFSVIECQL